MSNAILVSLQYFVCWYCWLHPFGQRLLSWWTCPHAQWAFWQIRSDRQGKTQLELEIIQNNESCFILFPYVSVSFSHKPAWCTSTWQDMFCCLFSLIYFCRKMNAWGLRFLGTVITVCLASQSLYLTMPKTVWRWAWTCVRPSSKWHLGCCL